MSCRYTKSPFLYSLRRLKHVLWKESVMLRSSFTVSIFNFTRQLIKVSEGLRILNFSETLSYVTYKPRIKDLYRRKRATNTLNETLWSKQYTIFFIYFPFFIIIIIIVIIIRKAHEAHYVHKGRTREPLGINGRDDL